MKQTVSVLVVIGAMCHVTAFAADSPGWGLLVNRTNQAVTLDVTGASGRTTAWVLQPSRSLKLRSESRYTIRVRESGDSAVVEAERRQLKVFDFNNPMFRFNPREPQWSKLGKLDDGGVPNATPWVMRWYQITDIDQRPQIRSGFGEREVNEVLSDYREQLKQFGFELTTPFVYSPFNAMVGRYQITGPESIEAALGNEARRQQHRMIAAALRKMIVADADDIAASGSAEGQAGDLLILNGQEEMASAIRPGVDYSDFSMAISLHPVSPEVFGLVTKVVARIGGVDESKVAFVIPLIFAAAPSGYFPLSPEIINGPLGLVGALQSVMLTAINEDDVIRTLTFTGFDQPSESTDGESAKISKFTARSAWMYHGISHNVLCKTKIAALRRTDLRFRVAATGSIKRFANAQPVFQVEIRCEIETRPGGGSLASYRQWNGELPMVVVPIGATMELDLNKATYELQSRIQERCVAKPPT